MDVMMNRVSQGFTLIELMISVAILGILVAIAYPAYTSYINDAWRSNAQLCLHEIAQELEGRYSADFSYSLQDLNVNGTDDALEGGCVVEGGMARRYQFAFNPTLTASGAAGFLIQSSPVNSQLNDRCGVLGVNEQGSVIAQQLDCWN